MDNAVYIPPTEIMIFLSNRSNEQMMLDFDIVDQSLDRSLIPRGVRDIGHKQLEIYI